MIMLGSINDNQHGKVMKQPDEIGGAETRSTYLVVRDADAVYVQAKAAGAEMVIDIDLEGHIWDVGTYDPWQAE